MSKVLKVNLSDKHLIFFKKSQKRIFSPSGDTNKASSVPARPVAPGSPQEHFPLPVSDERVLRPIFDMLLDGIRAGRKDDKKAMEALLISALGKRITKSFQEEYFQKFRDALEGSPLAESALSRVTSNIKEILDEGADAVASATQNLLKETQRILFKMPPRQATE